MQEEFLKSDPGVISVLHSYTQIAANNQADWKTAGFKGQSDILY